MKESGIGRDRSDEGFHSMGSIADFPVMRRLFIYYICSRNVNALEV